MFSEGDALRVLERESNLKSVSLLQVQRQTHAEYKAAVEALRNHPAEGFNKLEAMGAIREVDWRLRAQEVSKAYREAAAVPNGKGQERSVLVVAATHDEIKSVTFAIRQDRQRTGELSQGEIFVQHTALDWTEAQKKQTKNYQAGQVLEFHKSVKGVAKNEALEVVNADKGTFHNGRQFAAWLGLVPRQNSSGINSDSQALPREVTVTCERSWCTARDPLYSEPRRKKTHAVSGLRRNRRSSGWQRRV